MSASPKQSATIQVDIMSLFTSIDRKLDNVAREISLKTDLAMFNVLNTKVTELEVHGSINAQRATEGVERINQQLATMGWKIVAAIGTAVLAVIATIVVALVKH